VGTIVQIQVSSATGRLVISPPLGSLGRPARALFHARIVSLERADASIPLFAADPA
jgi:hypothetical protein